MTCLSIDPTCLANAGSTGNKCLGKVGPPRCAPASERFFWEVPSCAEHPHTHCVSTHRSGATTTTARTGRAPRASTWGRAATGRCGCAPLLTCPTQPALACVLLLAPALPQTLPAHARSAPQVCSSRSCVARGAPSYKASDVAEEWYEHAHRGLSAASSARPLPLCRVRLSCSRCGCQDSLHA